MWWEMWLVGRGGGEREILKEKNVQTAESRESGECGGSDNCPLELVLRAVTYFLTPAPAQYQLFQRVTLNSPQCHHSENNLVTHNCTHTNSSWWTLYVYRFHQRLAFELEVPTLNEICTLPKSRDNTYLGSQVNWEDMSAYGYSFELRPHLSSRAVTRTKILLHKNLIRPVRIYGAPTWTTTKTESQNLLIFKR